MEDINEQRFRNGEPYLLIHPRSYEDEKAELPVLRKRAKEDFLFHQTKSKEYLHRVNTAEDLPSFCDQINASMNAADPNEVEAINREMGEWFISYLVDNGYAPQMDSVLIKQAIMSSFPHVGNTKEEGRHSHCCLLGISHYPSNV